MQIFLLLRKVVKYNHRYKDSLATQGNSNACGALIYCHSLVLDCISPD